MHSFNSMSLAELPVTPMMFLLKLLRQLFRTSGRSLSGSMETKTIFNLRQAPSGRFLMILYNEEMQQRVLGLMSGHLVYPKQTKQQYPDSILLEKASPSLFIRVHSPPTNDYLVLASVRPLISSSKKSSCSLLLASPAQTMQARPATRITKPIIPVLLTPEQVFCYYYEAGPEFRAFCYCIIQASSLFLGCLSTEKLNDKDLYVEYEG